jgi:glutathione reductase (NADPH)
MLRGPNEVEVDRPHPSARSTCSSPPAGGRSCRCCPGHELAVTSNEMFDLPEFPRRLVVIGGGYIASEFASIFAGLGSQVTQVYRGEQILRGFDDDIRHFVAAEMRKKGIVLHTQAQVTQIEPRRG